MISIAQAELPDLGTPQKVANIVPELLQFLSNLKLQVFWHLIVRPGGSSDTLCALWPHDPDIVFGLLFEQSSDGALAYVTYRRSTAYPQQASIMLQVKFLSTLQEVSAHSSEILALLAAISERLRSQSVTAR